jgi:hypothetical protein
MNPQQDHTVQYQSGSLPWSNITLSVLLPDLVLVVLLQISDAHFLGVVLQLHGLLLILAPFSFAVPQLFTLIFFLEAHPHLHLYLLQNVPEIQSNQS